MTKQTGTLMTQRGVMLKTRADLGLLPVPEGTATHQPLSHAVVVEALVESLGFRHINVVRDEYAVSTDGMKMFGVLDLETTFAKDVTLSIQPGTLPNGMRLVAFIQDPRSGHVLGVAVQKL